MPTAAVLEVASEQIKGRYEKCEEVQARSEVGATRFNESGALEVARVFV